MSSMIRLNFNKPLMNAFMEKPITKDGKDLTLADQVIDTIGTQSGSKSQVDSLKVLGWIRTLIHDGGVLIVDKADYQTLKSIIEEDTRLLAFAKGQILEEIIEAPSRKHQTLSSIPENDREIPNEIKRALTTE